jgi:hypothetical protein
VRTLARRGQPISGDTPTHRRAPFAAMCRICSDATSPGYTMCLSCRAVALGLGRPLVPVTFIRAVGPNSGLYRALRQYKSGEPGVAQRQERRLAAILDAFCARHLAALAPDGLDLSVVVPSAPGNRPPPHPLARAVASAAHLPPYRDVLHAAAGTIGHRQPALGAYRADPSVAGKRVLVVDDVYTSGAHLQSAGAALTDASAAAVTALVIGRYDRGHTQSPPRCDRVPVA